MQRRRSWLQGLAAVVEDYGAPGVIVLAQAVIAWATSPIFPINRPRLQWWLFWPSVVAAAVAGIFLLFRTRRTSTLIVERDELANVIQAQRGGYRAVFEAHLEHISDGMRLSRDERISVYRFKHGKFVPLARYSENAALRERSRAEYSRDQGCIAAAWSEGMAFENDLPSFKKQPDVYIQRQLERWRMPEDITRGINMKSRTIAAFLIEDDQRQGVIVFESLNKSKLQKAELERIMRIENKHIAHMLRVWAPFEPDMTAATAEGF